MIFSPGEIFDERQHAAFKIKSVGDRYLVAAVKEINPNAFREIRRLAQMVENRFVIEFKLGKNLAVRAKT